MKINSIGSDDVETATLHEVNFSGIAQGGDAVGRDATGRVVFSPFAAPGDVATVRATRNHKSFVRGHLQQLQKPSALRVAPPCPFYRPPIDENGRIVSAWNPNQSCGGCQIQHIEYAAQLAAKRDFVVQALRRIGAQGDATENLVQACVPSPLPFGYRNKADFVVAAKPEDSATPFTIGFFARESHHAIDITHCPIQHENNNRILTATREALKLGLVAPFQFATAHRVLKSLVARTASNGDALVVLETNAEPWPEAEEFAAFLRERVPSLVGVLQRVNYDEAHKKSSNSHVLSGRDWLEETVDGLTLRVTGDGFFQVNAALTPMLVQTALRLARLESAFRVLDLYCGVGLFSLAMARTGAEVVGIEANPQAIRDARGNSERNGLSARFVEGDAARVLRRPQFKPNFDVALLDPPRAGAADCVHELLRLKPRRIVYVSCDPATLARDIKTLSSAYRLAEVVPLDLFPQTAHVETVARLETID